MVSVLQPMVDGTAVVHNQEVFKEVFRAMYVLMGNVVMLMVEDTAAILSPNKTPKIVHMVFVRHKLDKIFVVHKLQVC